MPPRVYSAETQCAGKRPYVTKDEAKRAAKRSEASFGRMHAYRCAHCGDYHIGHKPKIAYDFTAQNGPAR